MANFMDRYGKSLAFSLGVHFVGAVILGLVSYQIHRTPPNIMEVTLAGGGGGSAAATTAENTTAPVATDKDAIVDKKLKPKELQLILEQNLSSIYLRQMRMEILQMFHLIMPATWM